MALHSVTVQLPDEVYHQIKTAAERSKRPLQALLTEAITASVPMLNDPASIQQLRSSLVPMVYLNDAALWQAARATLTPSTQLRLESLHHKQQTEPLAAAEVTEMESLEALYRDTIMVRAQAAFLLKQRQYNVADLTQFSLVE